MTGPRIRSALRDAPVYKPGAPAVARRDRKTYKLSSNENPYPPPAEIVDAAQRAIASMGRYPDAASTRLVDALAGRLEVPRSHLAMGTGSVALLYHLSQAMCTEGDEAIYAWRSFEAYPIATKVAGATAIQVPLTPDARHDLPAMADAITERTRVVFICTPNNPTGPTVTRSELEAFYARVPSDVLVVLDEAYVEFVRDPETVDGVEFYRDKPNVAVLRTLSKAQGLAGFRVGYAIAHDDVAAAIRLCTPPFPVSVLAQETALAALEHGDVLLERVDEIVKERDRLAGGLRDLGYTVPSTGANFVWLELGEQTDAFAAACDEVGVVVRGFSGEGCRITAGEPEAGDLVLEAAEAFRTGGS